MKMKAAYLLLSLVLSLSSWAQTFKIQNNTSIADLDICQENHHRILKKFSNQADSLIERMLKGLEIEERAYTPEFKLDLYRELLSEILIRRIILSELSKQLDAQKISAFYSVRANLKKPILSPESILINLESQYELTLKQVIAIKNLKISEKYLKSLKAGLLRNALTILISKKYRKIGAGIFAQIVTKQGSKVITSGLLKSAAISFGSKFFISGATGLVISLVTFPLHAYRLPGETEWTDLLVKNPEMVMVPEWMAKGGITDHPWMTHCNAIQRRTSYVEKALSKSISLDESEFLSKVAAINLLEEPKIEQKLPLYFYQPEVASADNTNVKRPIISDKDLAPHWAHKVH
jgi:hypothetical protein